MFLIPILHQTTTYIRSGMKTLSLFLIPILHQTTTILFVNVALAMLFLIPILHQTTTPRRIVFLRPQLFLIPILHQTTTRRTFNSYATRCFSFQFYIKPQLFCIFIKLLVVVSHSNSTSNHNPGPWQTEYGGVVSHSNSTSNHNRITSCIHHGLVVSHSNSTSNHNYSGGRSPPAWVVSHSNSTSNHNTGRIYNGWKQLFLIPILHQTTTSRMAVIHILHVTHMTPMHKTSCRTPGKLVGCNFVFQRAVYQKNSSC